MKSGLLDVQKVVAILVSLAALLTPQAGWCQSFNIDLDVFFGPPESGNGTPSPSFGAAANQPGLWNRVSANGPTTPTALVGLTGNATGVTLLAAGDTGTAGGNNNPANTGDYALLLNDTALFLTSVEYHFEGLANGLYEVFTYAVDPQGQTELTEVNVAGAFSPNPQFVTGPMPGNSFAYLVTHSIHSVQVTTGDLLITVQLRQQERNSDVNGFQLVLVPEPLGATTFVLALAGMAFARRSRLWTK